MKNPKNLGEEFKISWKNSRKSRSNLKYIVLLRISGKVLEVLHNLIIRWYRLQMIKAKMVGFLLGIKVGPLEHFLEYRIFLKLLTMFKLKTQHWSSFMHEEILFQRKNSVRKIFQLFSFVSEINSTLFVEILEAKVSSGSEENIHLLFDGVVQCFPNEDLYFSTEKEYMPRIEIDLSEPRIVLGVTIYFRDDIIKPHVNRKLI